MEAIWLELGHDGRMVGWSVVRERGERMENASAMGYRAENGVIYGDEGQPGRYAFLTTGDLAIDAEGMRFVLRRAYAPVLGLDVLGSWRVFCARGETVTFSASESDGLRVTFSTHGRTESGTWRVSENGLAVETLSRGSVLYTAFSRDGVRRTLSGPHGTLVLEPLDR